VEYDLCSSNAFVTAVDNKPHFYERHLFWTLGKKILMIKCILSHREKVAESREGKGTVFMMRILSQVPAIG
jgi:hypothetical protein